MEKMSEKEMVAGSVDSSAATRGRWREPLTVEPRAMRTVEQREQWLAGLLERQSDGLMGLMRAVKMEMSMER